jgi:hypothetical protein
MKYVGSTLYPCAQLRAGKSQGSQPTVKQSLIEYRRCTSIRA